jgi:hypothetical protein
VGKFNFGEIEKMNDIPFRTSDLYFGRLNLAKRRRFELRDPGSVTRVFLVLALSVADLPKQSWEGFTHCPNLVHDFYASGEETISWARSLI